MYEFFKALHIFGLILMAGNVTVTAFWKVFADRTSKTQIIGFAQWLVTVTDFTFTLTGGFLMVIGGYGAALVGGLSLFETPWLVLGQLMLLRLGRGPRLSRCLGKRAGIHRHAELAHDVGDVELHRGG